jgi:hypothetical protein
MPDISMCSGLGCDLKHECYRHTAKYSYRQAFFSEPPIKDGKCEYYWRDNQTDMLNDIVNGNENNSDGEDK